MPGFLRPCTVFVAVLFIVASGPGLMALPPGVVLKTEKWANTDDAFAEFSVQVEESAIRNLLTRRGAILSGRDGVGEVSRLADSAAGVRGGDGRVGIGGQPAIVTCYLGKATPVHQVGFYTFNIDARANQDYEVRFADNSSNPGKQPVFPEEPALSTGPTVIGPDSGGFHSCFRREDGAPLAGQADWVEFRIWRTYNVKAGHTAHSTDAEGWTAGIELEVLGRPDDVLILSEAEKARRRQMREAPRSPRYEKKDSWWESMVAMREQLLAWETEIDRLMLPEQDAAFGQWYGIGPFDAASSGLRDAERAQTLDTGREWEGKRWQPLTDVQDGTMTDLGGRFPGREGQIILIAREAALHSSFDWRNPFSIGIGGRNARFRLAPSSSAAGCPDAPPVPNQRVWNISGSSGNYVVMGRLQIEADGTCVFYFMPFAAKGSPSAGNVANRTGRRNGLSSRVRQDFPDALSRQQLDWEVRDRIWMFFHRQTMARIDYEMTDWLPGHPDFLAGQYQQATQARLESLKDEVRSVEPEICQVATPCLVSVAAAGESKTTDDSIQTARERYYDVCTIHEAIREAHRIESVQLAVEDHLHTFSDGYPHGPEYLERIRGLREAMADLWPRLETAPGKQLPELLALRDRIDTESQQILLATPLLSFEKLILVKGGPGFASNWGGANRLGNEIVTLSPVAPDGEITTLLGGVSVSDLDLHFGAQRILFSDGRYLYEVNVDGSGLRKISSQEDRHVMHYDGCYLPDGGIMFVSTACEQAVPCTGQWYVGNMHRMELDGSRERRLTFDQDHNWNPFVLNNGRIIYTRWEYTDTPHYFSRLLFHMNPDGSGQMEYYGSNSYWPNAMYWPKPIPGHSSEIVCVVSGHHGVSREGELILLDPARGRFEADGVVQRIPGRGQAVEPVIADGLVGEVWPRFACPYPLAEPGTNRGAGRYFLVNCRPWPWEPWGIYLVDIYDNMTPIIKGSYSNPIPLLPRECPPVIPPRTNPERTTTGFVFMADVYRGPGVRNYPKGTVKALRIASHHYRYGGNGDTYASSYDGGWDVKRIIGTVPVNPDGSCFFEAPANTPIFVQPLDADGKALQTMRSWFSVMPGETLSCVGCHEKQNSTAPPQFTVAGNRSPEAIRPWFGPARGFGFDQEVQPVLDRKCAGCHNGAARPDGSVLPDLRAKQLHEGYDGRYSPAYMALHPYVRRAGYEADYHMPAPGEFDADTSPLVQMLKNGHHGVCLDREEWERLYAWIDLNIPYAPTWRQSHRPPEDEQVERRAKYKKLYANLDDRDEVPLPVPPVCAFVPPGPEKAPSVPAAVAGWPFTPDDARQRQYALEKEALNVDLGGNVSMTFVPIPGGVLPARKEARLADSGEASPRKISRAFYLGTCEVTNEQYARFDSEHDSAYIEARGKDRFTRGYPISDPRQPVVRITWDEATAFCSWMSRETGFACSLPEEDEWEWACRCGSGDPWPFADPPEKLTSPVANVADSSLGRWGWGRCEKNYQDGVQFTAPVGTYPASSWGLYDMIGNVAEWTAGTYSPEAEDLKIVRGGSWNDCFRSASSESRWRYPRWQPVYNVGFRVKIDPDKAVALNSPAE